MRLSKPKNKRGEGSQGIDDIHQRLKKEVISEEDNIVRFWLMAYSRQERESLQNESILSRNGTRNTCRRVSQMNNLYITNNLR